MTTAKTQSPKYYDLESRTFEFAKSVRIFVSKLPRNVASIEDVKQLVRSSGSVGANYIEANESLGKKDFAMRLRICRKESKETIYWLKLTVTPANQEPERLRLIKEASQLTAIFGSIIVKLDG